MQGSQSRCQTNLPHAAVGADCRDQDGRLATRTLAEETPVALAYNGTTLAVVAGKAFGDEPDLRTELRQLRSQIASLRSETEFLTDEVRERWL